MQLLQRLMVLGLLRLAQALPKLSCLWHPWEIHALLNRCLSACRHRLPACRLQCLTVLLCQCLPGPVHTC